MAFQWTMRAPARRVLAFGMVLAAAAYIGCSDDNTNNPAGTNSSVATVTGAGAGSSCQLGAPDGTCIPEGPSAEDCSCPDCTTRDVCTGGCVDDGTCSTEEDCSCTDCYLKVNSCAPNTNGCDDEPLCQPDESCLCPDCAGEAFCQQCTNNGECVDFNEGCACVDCSGDPECASGNASSSSAGAGGAGGNGGSAGGMGGAGASGGAGGNGGA